MSGKVPSLAKVKSKSVKHFTGEMILWTLFIRVTLLSDDQTQILLQIRDENISIEEKASIYFSDLFSPFPSPLFSLKSISFFKRSDKKSDRQNERGGGAEAEAEAVHPKVLRGIPHRRTIT